MFEKQIVDLVSGRREIFRSNTGRMLSVTLQSGFLSEDRVTCVEPLCCPQTNGSLYVAPNRGRGSAADNIIRHLDHVGDRSPIRSAGHENHVRRIVRIRSIFS